VTDLTDVEYDSNTLQAMAALIGETIEFIEEDGIGVELTLCSKKQLYFFPEELWVSSKTLDEVGYAWLKRAITLEPTPKSPDYPYYKDVFRGIAQVIDVRLVDTVAVFDEPIHPQRFHEGVGCWFINPDQMTDLDPAKKMRHATAEIGFLIITNLFVVSLMTYDNGFSVGDYDNLLLESIAVFSSRYPQYRHRSIMA